IRRRPLAARFRRREVRSNPPPSSGGILIAYGLRLLDRMPPERAGSAQAIAELAATMRAQDAVRGGSFSSDLYRGGRARKLLSARIKAVTSTTHISVVDAAGNAASLSASAGSGSGVVIPGTGIHMNNMLGELDLQGSTLAGTRLTSMMAPSVVLERGRPR